MPQPTEEVPLSVKRALPCLYKYEEPKPEVIATDIVKGTAVSSTEVTASTPAASQSIGADIEDTTVEDVTVQIEVDVEAEQGNSSGKTLPTSASFPASTLISSSNTKRKRITPTVVSALGGQAFSGNMLVGSSSSGNGNGKNSGSNGNGSDDIIDLSGSSSNSSSSGTVTGVDGQVVSLPVPLSPHSDEAPNAFASPEGQTVSVSVSPAPLGIVFPVIPSTLISSNSTLGVETKKVNYFSFHLMSLLILCPFCAFIKTFFVYPILLSLRDEYDDP